MELTEIDSLEDESLKIYNTLRDNIFTKDNSFIADSPKVVNLILESGLEVKSILATKEYYEEFQHLIEKKEIKKLYVADKKIMESIVGHKIHHNAMLHGVRPQNILLEDLSNNIIMLDEITSTENIGSIARSAAALGVDSYLLPKSGPHPFGRRALRVSMGYASKLKISIYENIFETITTLKSEGYKIYGAEVTNSSIPLSKVKISEKWVLLMGHEGKGLSQEVQNACDELVEIEMNEGVKSFNVSVAASIMMYGFRNRG